MSDLRSSAEEEKKSTVCSQCKIFQEERDERTRKFDESRREIETLKQQVSSFQRSDNLTIFFVIIVKAERGTLPEDECSSE